MTATERQSWSDIRDRLHGRILDGTYRPGDKLPRDEDLAAELGCARSTVQRAMRALSEAGIVERRRKGGTTVRINPVTRATLDIPVTRLEIEARGAVYGYHLLARARALAPPVVTAGLGLSSAREMLHVKALHLADGQPFVFEDRWISLDTVPEIEAVDLTRHSANEWLVHHRPYDRCDIQIFARAASAADAELMQVAQGDALLIVERTTWIGEAPITRVQSVSAPGYRLNAAS